MIFCSFIKKVFKICKLHIKSQEILRKNAHRFDNLPTTKSETITITTQHGPRESCVSCLTSLQHWLCKDQTNRVTA